MTERGIEADVGSKSVSDPSPSLKWVLNKVNTVTVYAMISSYRGMMSKVH